MIHRAWSSQVEVPYCFSRSSVKFQGHTALKIFEFDPNWAFPESNSSLNSPMAMKCCTKLETAKERCPIVFQGHPSNFKVTRDKISPILTQIGHFRTIGRSQLSNPSDLPCLIGTCECCLVKWPIIDQKSTRQLVINCSDHCEIARNCAYVTFPNPIKSAVAFFLEICNFGRQLKHKLISHWMDLGQITRNDLSVVRTLSKMSPIRTKCCRLIDSLCPTNYCFSLC